MKFKPLHDRVVVKRIDTDEKSAGGIVIRTVYHVIRILNKNYSIGCSMPVSVLTLQVC